jgi:hypothetical protein
MKVCVLWVVAQYNLLQLIDVSEVFAASIIRAMFKTRAQKRIKMKSSRPDSLSCEALPTLKEQRYTQH